MKHSNIAFFIPHLGCPHNCVFCNQKSISASESLPDGKTVVEACGDAAKHLGARVSATEIAFFGGSFTGIDREYMIELLDAAKYCVDKYGFYGIRCSTRPDSISQEIIEILKDYGVTSIELGCQSMTDHVLSINSRGHTSQDIIDASMIIKGSGISLGHQMMVGMYGDSGESVMYTAKALAALEPDTMRIYPTVVIKNTELETLWRDGEYTPLSLESAVDICAELLLFFENSPDHKCIKVIRMGLHASDSLERDMLAGVYHPAFRELCESKIMLGRALSLMESPHKDKTIYIHVNPKDISKMIGQHRSNINKLSDMGHMVKVIGDQSVSSMEVHLR